MTSANAEFKICSLNVNGLGDFKKRKDVFSYLRDIKYDIYLLQETHFKANQENFIRASWGYEAWVAGVESNSKGVAILFNPSFEYKIHDINRDPNGTYLALDITIMQKRTTLISIYGPSEGDNPAFIGTIDTIINTFSNETVIIGGDWNCLLNLNIDARNYTSTVNRPRTRNKIKDLMADNNLIDIFRCMHPDKRAYTWRRFNTVKQGRLDYFLISEDLSGQTMKTFISPGYRSDHSLVTLTLRKNELKRDRQFWKFNNSLLKDKCYIEVVKSLIHTIRKQYAVPIYNSDNIENITPEDIQFTISDQLFFETLLMEIRRKTISYASYKKKRDTKEEEELKKNILLLEEDLEHLEDNRNELEQLKQALEISRVKKIDGIIVRSKVQWVKDGEKATKYFCNLEKRNFTNRTISFLERSDGQAITEQENILAEVHDFYKNLYSHKDTKDIDLQKYKEEAVCLTPHETVSLEGDITIEEAKITLKNMKNFKSPGPDGFTVEFYKFFFVDIGHYLIRSVNEGFRNGSLSITQYQGVITCIPKDKKPKQFIKNWRPISLLNVSYKIISSCIAGRIKSVLPSIIHESQKGFMKGRYIGENIRLLYDTIVLTEKEKIPGLLLMIDFEKAFDSVAWSFIEKALNFFNFPKGLIDWFRVLYSKPSSCVSFNGQYSKWFNLQRGCRQGDPISPYLYLVCAEILSIMIRSNEKIKGIKLTNKEILLSLFADDTTLYLDGTEQSFNEAIKTLDLFSTVSGLRMNNDKTQIQWIGSRKNSNVKYMSDRNFIWDPGKFKVLGIYFSVSQDIVSINFENKIEEIKREIARWKKRQITPLGKITIIKTLIISKLNYLFLNIPDPTKAFLKELDQILFRFVWGGKTNRIKKTTLCKTYEEGGLKMVDIYAFLASMKISWLRRIVDFNQTVSAWHSLYPVLHYVEQFGYDYIRVCKENVKNPFWLDVLEHYRKLYITNHGENVSAVDVNVEPIHYNDNIKRGRETIYIREWANNGIIRVNDILDAHNHIISFNTFKDRFNVPHTNFIIYAGVTRAIRKFVDYVSNDIYKLKRLTAKEVWFCIRAGNLAVNSKFQEKNVLPTAVIKWNSEFQGINWKNIFKHCFKTSKDPQLQWFQTRLLHRILPTQKYLALCKITDSPLCTFCVTSIESIRHLFWDCKYVQDFWKDLNEYIKEKCTHCDRLNFNIELILFGVSKLINTDKPLNFIILFAKFYIYKCKLETINPILNNFIRQLQYRYIIEKNLALKNNKETEFQRNWQIYSEIFNMA